MWNRREFLQSSAAVLSAATIAPGPGDAAPASGAWFDRPMRWAQLTLVEDDPGNYDLHVLARLLPPHPLRRRVPQRRRLRRLLPDEVPLHHRSQCLGDRDPFGDLVAGCRKLGMIVIARTDPHAVHQDVYDAHPDWIAVDADGQEAPPLGRCPSCGSPARSVRTTSSS